MRLTIVPSDKAIIVDGQAYSGITTDWSWCPENVHALQWYDTWGEIEHSDNSPNEKIESLGIYQEGYDIFMRHKEGLEIEEIEKQEEIERTTNWDRIFRKIRNRLLYDSDWTQMPDSPLSESEKESWKNYRQQLRDLPQSITVTAKEMNDESHNQWPVPPS